MKQILLLIHLTIKQQLKNPPFLFFLILMPLIILHTSKIIISDNDENNICIGIYTDSYTTISEQVFDELSKNNGIISFIEYEDLELMRTDIIKNKLECGYVFPENLKEKLDKKDYKNTVTLMCGSNSNIIGSLSNEIVFSAILKIYGENIIKNYISSNELLNTHSDELFPLIDEKYSSYLNSDTVFHVEFNTISPDGSLDDLETIEAATSLFPLRGIASVLIFAAGMFGSLQFLTDKSSGTFITMKQNCRIAAYFVYPFVLSLLTGISAAIALTFSNISAGFVNEITAILPYIFIITIYCAALSSILRNENIFAASLPVMIILCLVACPVFINLAPLLPAIKIIRYFLPPTFYLS